jgi:hypothetical protein
MLIAQVGSCCYSLYLFPTRVHQVVRYLSITCGVFWIVWGLLKHRIVPYKLDPQPVNISQIRREIGWSLCSLVIFSSVAIHIFWLRKAGFTKIYGNLNEFGVPYFVWSVLAMLMVKSYFVLAPSFLIIEHFCRNINLISYQFSVRCTTCTSTLFIARCTRASC